jgi:hypothetical protein
VEVRARGRRRQLRQHDVQVAIQRLVKRLAQRQLVTEPACLDAS